MFVAAAAGTHQLLAFRFPSIAGVPALDGNRRLFAAATERLGNRGAVVDAEWIGFLHTLGGELSRAEYHFSRFNEVLSVMRRRRTVAGGPVFADPEPARAVYCEAVAHLAAIRTFVDIAVYMAARRLGLDGRRAEDWQASQAIGRDPLPDRYAHSPEIGALRRHSAWFAQLNTYRNCMNHRGWHPNSFGYFERADTAPESGDPLANVMLVPDLRSLAGGSRPGTWTYEDRTWLDQLLGELGAGFDAVLDALFDIWGIPIPEAARIPYAEQPGVFLTVPAARPIKGQEPPVIYVFTSKFAVRAFIEKLRRNGLEIAYRLRALRPTRLKANEEVYLLGYDFNLFGPKASVQVIEHSDGQPRMAASLQVEPQHAGDFAQSRIEFKLPGTLTGTVYVLDGPDPGGQRRDQGP